MSQSRLVLLLGQDYRLVQTRQWVLESSGLTVRTATNLIELERISAREQVDLFLFCDSLQPGIRSGAVALISERWPLAKRLLLTPAVLPIGVEDESFVFSAAEGSARLLKTIHSLLADTAETSDIHDQPFQYS